MSDKAQADLMRQALHQLRELKAKLARQEQRPAREPIAVVGMGCRLPAGVTTPDELWERFASGRDAVGEVPAERWDVDTYYDPDRAAPGKMYTRRGAFVEGVDEFEPQFFGVSPREAEHIDPQHRLLLEVCWHALEDAGIAPEGLKGSATGVFVGLCSDDYYQLSVSFEAAEAINPYTGPGTSRSVAAGRIAYVLGARGPALQVDTSCSSSLVAVHLACQALRNGECDLALAGGVHLLLSPLSMVARSKVTALSPDGVCRAFDAAANGFVPGEGCGVLALKRLSDARAAGDRVLGVIAGSAVNHNGKTNGLAAPSPAAQAEVIRRALADAGVEPTAVSYVEAHGTGTSLGDPIEAEALTAVFGPGRAPDAPLWVGSAKTNFGHLEAAAGVLSLQKALLALRHRALPPQLHFERPNPHIDWGRSPLKVLTRLTSWEATAGARTAGVSSFGMSGTNAHVVVREAPPAEPLEGAAPGGPRLLPLSARTNGALRELARRYAEALRAPSEGDFADACFTAATGRNGLPCRAAFVARDAAEAADTLERFAAEGPTEGSESPASPVCAFVFAGQGAQRAEMGLALREANAAFRQVFDRCDELLRPRLGLPLVELLGREGDGAARLDETGYAQPALFALEYALAQLWLAWGIEPRALLGHSLGEIVAATVAGVFELEDAIELVLARAALMQALPRDGAMAAVFADEAAVAGVVAPRADRLAIAAINGPASTVLAGERGALDEALRELQGRGVETRPLRVSHAFHSPLLAPMLGAFAEVARRVRYRRPERDVVSNVTGRVAGDEIATPDYWVRHVREPVRFADGVRTLTGLGVRTFVEVGPGATLSALGRSCTAGDADWLPSLRPGAEVERALETLGALYVRGTAVNWAAVCGARGRKVALPTYPFERKTYRNETTRAAMKSTEAERGTGGERARGDGRLEAIAKGVAQILAELLRLPARDVRRSTPLLELGADSIMLVTALRLLDERYGIKLSIRQLFEELNTVDAVAAYLHEHAPSAGVEAAPPVAAGKPAPADRRRTEATSPLAAPTQVAPAQVAPAQVAPAQVAPAPARVTPPTYAAPTPPSPPAPVAPATYAAPPAAPPALPAPQAGAAPYGAPYPPAQIPYGQAPHFGAPYMGVPAGPPLVSGAYGPPPHMPGMAPPIAAYYGNGTAAPYFPPYAPHPYPPHAPPPYAPPSYAASPYAPPGVPPWFEALRHELGALGERLRGLEESGRPVPSAALASSATLTSSAPLAPPTAAGPAHAPAPFAPTEGATATAWKPPPPRPLTGLQSRHLAAFTSRYNERTAASKARRAGARTLCNNRRSSGGFRLETKELLYPIVATRSAGSRFWDLDGNEYVDLAMGFGAHFFGHDAPFIREAVEAQLRRGFSIGPEAELAVEVSELVCRTSGLDRVLFNNSGTEAVMTALRVARAATGRPKIAMFANAYHGHFDGTLAVPAGEGGASAPMALGTPAAMTTDTLVLPFDDARAFDALEAHASQVAAVIVEPVQNRRPDLHPGPFLRRLREFTREHGIALIFDEILVGYRIDLGGAQRHFGVEADLVTYGKVVGGGLPLGVLAGRSSFMDRVDGGLWSYGDASQPEVESTYTAGTFSKHPLALAASCAVLREMVSAGPSLQTSLNERTAGLVRRLNAMFEAEGTPFRAVHFGSFFRFASGGNLSFVYQPLELDLFFYHLIAQGVYVWEGRTCFLSTAHSDADLEHVFDACERAVRQLREGGFLPDAPGRPEPRAEVRAPSPSPSPPAAEAPASFASIELSPTPAPPVLSVPPPRHRPSFSLYYFGDYQAAFHDDKYGLLLAGAKFADERGFEAVWTPERHFHSFGGFSPNPAVVSAALARETKAVQIRSSVILPIHHPIRVAEEWSIVDNLARGRVGVAFASGWHPDDFVFAPERWGKHRDAMYAGVDIVRRLWRGEAVRARGGSERPIEVRLHPLPMQRELPIWLTSLGSTDTFVKAGQIGAGVLTNLIGQTPEALAPKIALYRQALADSGFDPAAGRVTALVHTLVGTDLGSVRQTARDPFCRYLGSSVGLFQKMAEQEGQKVDFKSLSPEDRAYLLRSAYERYVQDRALVGTVESCAPIVEALERAGVDEIACFVDFGVEADAALAGLEHLDALRRRFAPAEPERLRYDAMAPIVSRQREARPAELAPRPAPAAATGAPLTRDQKMLWVIGKMGDDGAIAYNSSTSLRLRGPLDVEALRGAYRRVVERHEALRTTISPDGETQTVHERAAAELARLDLSALPEAARATAFDDFFRAESGRAFDLDGTLHRAHLLRLGPEEHVFVLTVHHLVCDGVSIGIILQEIEAFYSAAREGRRCELEAPMQFREFLAWRAAHERTPELRSQEEYWVDLARDLPALDLPTDRPRPPVKTFTGARETVRLDADVYGRLKRFSERHRCTHFMTLLAAFGLLLHRLAHQAQAVVGVAFAGRTPRGSESVVGYCANVYPIRSRVEGNPALAQYLAALKAELLEAYDRQDYTFGALVERAGRGRAPDRSPFFTVAFNWDRYVLPNMSGLDVSFQPQPIQYAEYDLMPNVMEVNGELVMMWDYNADLFDAPTVARMAACFQRLLGAFFDAPEGARVLDLPMLPPADERLLGDWNATAAPYPAGARFHELFEEHARRAPDAPALACGGQRATYGRLNEAANRVAHALAARGVRRGDFVALCADPHVATVAALLGAFKAGAAYVPLDPDHPRERREEVLADVHPKVVIAAAEIAHEFAAPGREVIALDARLSAFADQPTHDPGAGGDAADLAYVIFTSGSTGRPKGAQVDHRGVVNLVAAMREVLGFGARDVTLSIAPFSFDLSVPDLFLTLGSGAELVLAEKEARWQPARLIELLEAHAVSFMEATPPTWQMLFDHGWKGRPESLTTITGGETVATKLARQLFAGSKSFWNLYGPTEATAWTTYHRVSAADLERPILPIGRPLANVRVHLLDDAQRPVPVGAVGELCIGGLGVARGYLNRPDLNAAKFLRDPFAPAAEGWAKLYRTGDLARFLPDGRIEFIGRNDNQVKIRGFRIELGDVEAALRTTPGVKDAAVVCRPDARGERQLVAYVVPEGPAPLDEEAVRDALRAKLPLYMLPRALAPLAALPKSRNGKVDRGALPPVDLEARPAARVAPGNEVQRALARIWADVTNATSVGINDDFFLIGGSSLLLHVVRSRIKAELGATVTIRQLFRHTTIQSLETLIASSEQTAEGTAPAAGASQAN